MYLADHQRAGVIVPADDHYYPPGDDPFHDRGSFDYDVPAVTRSEERIAAFFAGRAASLPTVEAVRVGTVGSFHLDMSGEITLEVFPDKAFGEQRRLFRPGDRSRHFVVTAEGVEE